MGNVGNEHNILVGKPEGIRSFGRRCRGEDNIKMALKESGLGPVADSCEYTCIP
jgi:hypothetical protein